DLIFRRRVSSSGNRISWSADDLKRIREQIEKADTAVLKRALDGFERDSLDARRRALTSGAAAVVLSTEGIKAARESEDLIAGIYTTEGIDRAFDRMRMSGISWREYMNTGGSLLAFHNAQSFPIGRTVKLFPSASRATAVAKLAPEGVSEDA